VQPMLLASGIGGQWPNTISCHGHHIKRENFTTL
jgi:hypothetical protein